jgi:hypothetical protein
MRRDPRLGPGRDRVRLPLADDSSRDDVAEGAELARRVAEALGEGGRFDQVRTEPVVEVLAEAASRSRFVAATSFPGNRPSSLSPRRWKVRVWSTRS